VAVLSYNSKGFIQYTVNTRELRIAIVTAAAAAAADDDDDGGDTGDVWYT